MNFLAWFGFGIMVGALVHVIDPHPKQGGLLGAVVMGVIGTLTGGLLANLVFNIGLSALNFASAGASVIVALLLLIMGRSLKGIK